MTGGNWQDLSAILASIRLESRQAEPPHLGDDDAFFDEWAWSGLARCGPSTAAPRPPRSWSGLFPAASYVEPRQLGNTCPNDGTQLKTGPDGALYCPFDGWRGSVYEAEPDGAASSPVSDPYEVTYTSTY